MDHEGAAAKDASPQDHRLADNGDPFVAVCLGHLSEAEIAIFRLREDLERWPKTYECNAGICPGRHPPIRSRSSSLVESEPAAPDSLLSPAVSPSSRVIRWGSPESDQSSTCACGDKAPGFSPSVSFHSRDHSVSTALVFDQIVINSMDSEFAEADVVRGVRNVWVDGRDSKGDAGKTHDGMTLPVLMLHLPSWVPRPNLRALVMKPDTKVRLVWLLLQFLLIMYEIFTMPLYLAFEIQPGRGLSIVILVVNVYFMMDILVTFFTGFLNDDGVLVMSPKKIAVRYARSWLVPDLIAGIPWEWIGDRHFLQGRGATVRFVRMVRLVRVMRLLRLVRMKSLMDKLEMIIEAYRGITFIVDIMRVMVILFAITHWTACMWYIVGVRDTRDITWVDTYLAEYSDTALRYVYSLYFTLMTMTTVGYGDMSPQNPAEVGFVLVLLLLASIVFAGLMGVLSDIIQSMNKSRHIRSEKKNMLSGYMRWRAVPWALKASIRQHLLFLWDTNRDYDVYEEQIKAQLPPVLRRELCYHVYGRILTKAPFLAWMKDYSVCIKELANEARLMFLELHDNLFRKGQRNMQIYMLISGTVSLTQNQSLFHGEHVALGASCMDDLSVPRHRDLGIVDVGVHAFEKKIKLSGAPQRTRAEDLTRKVATMFHTGRPLQAPPSLHDDDRTEVLKVATQKMHMQDAAKHMAAMQIQHAWRRSRVWKLSQGGAFVLRRPFSQEFRPKPLSISTMQRQSVTAPSYFGESCLWVPMDDWDSVAPQFIYNAWCESQVELVYISRKAVQDVIERFSLRERFECFRLAVLDGMQELVEQRGPGNARWMRHSVDAAGQSVDPLAVDLLTNEDNEDSLPVSYLAAMARGHRSRQSESSRTPSHQDVSLVAREGDPARPRTLTQSDDNFHIRVDV